MKRVLAIQDLSCVGKIALAAALPVISAMGVECCPLPTALLSSHTAFRHVHTRALDDDMRAIIGAWRRENLTFDAILIGYLGSERQAALAAEAVEQLRSPGALVIVDPAMGDHGKLYSGVDASFPAAMKSLIRRADVALPNLTEAALLLDRPYEARPDSGGVRALLEALAALGPKLAVITGVGGGDELGAAALDARSGRSFRCMGPALPGSYFGTGDLFAAALAGALALGADPRDGLQLAVDFVADCIRSTLADGERRWYGVSFEARLGELALRARAIAPRADGIDHEEE